MTYVEHLKRSEGVAHFCDDLLADIRVQHSTQAVLALASFHQVFEHHIAIITLLKSNYAGSAFTLLRPIWEGLLRGLWLLHVATNEQIDILLKDDKFPPRKCMQEAIASAHEKFDRAGLARIVGEKTWDAMCSYAHGGTRPLLRRIEAEATTAVYSDEEKAELLRGADFFMLLAAQEAIAISDRQARWPELLEQIKATLDQIAMHASTPAGI
jgi:hypothetical protein